MPHTRNYNELPVQMFCLDFFQNIHNLFHFVFFWAKRCLGVKLNIIWKALHEDWYNNIQINIFCSKGHKTQTTVLIKFLYCLHFEMIYLKNIYIFIHKLF